MRRAVEREERAGAWDMGETGRLFSYRGNREEERPAIVLGLSQKPQNDRCQTFVKISSQLLGNSG